MIYRWSIDPSIHRSIHRWSIDDLSLIYRWSIDVFISLDRVDGHNQAFYRSYIDDIDANRYHMNNSVDLQVQTIRDRIISNIYKQSPFLSLRSRPPVKSECADFVLHRSDMVRHSWDRLDFGKKRCSDSTYHTKECKYKIQVFTQWIAYVISIVWSEVSFQIKSWASYGSGLGIT